MPEQPIEAGPPDNALKVDQATTCGCCPSARVPDMCTVMQSTGGPNFEDMLRESDDHMGQGNRGFPSELWWRCQTSTSQAKGYSDVSFCLHIYGCFILFWICSFHLHIVHILIEMTYFACACIFSGPSSLGHLAVCLLYTSPSPRD